MPQIQLYDFPRSSASYRVRIACHLKEIDFESILVNFRENAQRSPAYLKVAPSGLLPTLVVDGEPPLSQSLAILMKLDEIQPEPLLIPRDPALKYAAWEIALAIACDIHPLNNLRVLKYLEQKFGADEEERNAWYTEWVTLGFEAIEDKVKQYGGRFCVGDDVTIADICLAPQMFNARRFNVDLTRFPNLVEIDERLHGIDAFKKAKPEIVLN